MKRKFVRTYHSKMFLVSSRKWLFPPPPPTTDESIRDPKSRDEILARKMKLPFKVADIVNSPMDSFNDLITRLGLSPKQIKVCHDIRCCGNNKSEDKSEDEDDCDDGDDGDDGHR